MATPGGPLEICFSFDTTYSMTNYVDQVKARLQDMIQRLKSDIPGIKVALCAHGDYYQKYHDNKNEYITMYNDLTDDVTALCKFIQKATPTVGGDWDECYELVLREVQGKVNWSSGANKVLVMIGDATPHPVHDEDEDVNMDNIDWKQETKNLLDKGIRTYGVYCNTPNSGREDLAFFKELAKIGNGDFITLKKFDSIFDLMMAICYRENDEGLLHAYETEVRSRGGAASRDVNTMFTTLKKSASNASTSGLVAPATASTSTKAKRAATKPSTASKRPATKKGAKAVTPKTPRTTLAARTAKTRGTAKTTKTPRPTKTGMKTRMTTTKGNVSNTKSITKKRVVRKRLRRERVPQKYFGLREYQWSPWQPALHCKYTNQDQIRVNHTGFRVKSLFDGKTNKRALYEFAVQRKSSTYRYVVYSKLSSGFPSNSCWEDQLLNSKSLQSQIDKILKSEMNVCVRRLVIGKHRWHSTVTEWLKLYDYAWDGNQETGKSREVTSAGETISHEMDMH